MVCCGGNGVFYEPKCWANWSIDVLCRGLTGDPPTRVAPVRLKQKPHVQPPWPGRVCTRNIYLSGQWQVYSTPQVVFASIVMAMPKGASVHLVADDRAVKRHLEAIPWPHPYFEQAAEPFAGATCFSTLDLLQGLCSVYMAIDKEDEEAFTTVTQEGLFTNDIFRRGTECDPILSMYDISRRVD